MFAMLSMVIFSYLQSIRGSREEQYHDIYIIISMSVSLIPTVSQNAVRARMPLHTLDDYSENIEEYFETTD
jgi:hypothetical protein